MYKCLENVSYKFDNKSICCKTCSCSPCGCHNKPKIFCVESFCKASATTKSGKHITATSTATARSNISQEDAIKIAQNECIKVVDKILLSQCYSCCKKTTESTINLAQLVFYKIIQNNGIKSNIYGLCGATTYFVDENLQQLIDDGYLNYIHSSNESSSAYMASYEASLLKKVGITFQTAGPGTTMALTGIFTSTCESTPLIAFCGVPTSNFQYIKPTIAKDITKKYYYIENEDSDPESILNEAFDIALNGTKQSPGQGAVAIFVLDNLWLSTYNYCKTIKNTNCKCVDNNIIEFVNKIYSQINSDSRIIIRVGENVNTENATKLANLTLINPNIYVHLTLLSKTQTSLLEYDNVAIEGPLNSSQVNNNYNNANLIIDLGGGIEYSFIVFTDVIKNLDLNPDTTQIFYVNNEKLQYPPASSNSSNTLYTDVNKFIPIFLQQSISVFSIPKGEPNWVSVSDKWNYYNEIISLYIAQTDSNTGVYTMISIAAQVINIIYNKFNFTYNDIKQLIIDDEFCYTVDIGMSGFLSNSFLNHNRIDHMEIFGELSPIGSSISCLAGFLRTGNFKGGLCILGDGGFLNVPGYFVDLINVLNEKPKLKIMILLLNDNCYTNVANAEIKLFGTTTEITGTTYIQQYVDLFEVAKSLLGNKLVDSLKLSNLTTKSQLLDDFVNNWYDNDIPGMYLLYYETPNGIGNPTPIYI